MFIWLIIILALLGLGSLAAVVFGIVYAIVNKRPGVAVASLLVPVAIVLGLGLMAAIFSQASVPHAEVEHWTAHPPLAEHLPAGSLIDGPAIDKGIFLLPIWLLLVVVLVLIAALMRRSRGNGRRCAGWGKAAVVLAIVATLFALRVNKQSVNNAVRNQEAAARAMQEQIRTKFDKAKWQAIETKRKTQEVQAQTVAQVIETGNMTQLLEQLNRPRIKLDADGQNASVSMGDEQTSRRLADRQRW